MSENGPSDERLEAIYDRLDELDPNTFESRAAELLHGLGFSRVMMERKTKDMSGACGCAALFVACKGGK
jgi:ATP-binding cassette subfamily F protein 2